MKKFSILLVVFFISTPVNAILFIESGWQLNGATGVIVNDDIYDVIFTDGTCASLFSGCDDNGDFLFNNSEDARSASIALMLQVFEDRAYDYLPQRTRGIENRIVGYSAAYGRMVTPYELSDTGEINVSVITNCGSGVLARGCRDQVTGWPIPNSSYDTYSNKSVTWVVWTYVGVVDSPVSTPVPEPAPIFLLAAGLAGFGMARRKKEIRSFHDIL